jgi:hypothetical protein
VAQEYFINSQELEDKVKNLLPSQGGAGAGFDLSASTQIVPIIDLTESAEGSNLRSDLQTATDFATTYNQIINASNTVIINNTGFYKVSVSSDGVNSNTQINLFDGTTSKIIKYYAFGADSSIIVDQFIVFLSAGLSMRGTSSANTVALQVHTRQIASIDGTLTNPQNF